MNSQSRSAHSLTSASDTRKYDYDLFTIGGGSGGVRASRWAAAQHGAKVALAELPFEIISTKDTAGGLGGTCVIRGCVPKKLLIYGSRLPKDMEDASGYGWSWPREMNPTVDWMRLIQAKNAEVTRLNSIYARMLNGAGVDTIEGYARLVGPNAVQVGDKTYTAKYICIATGGRATRLPIPGCELPGVITSDEALALAQKPKSMVIIGAGYIALEFACFFHGYGTDVHLVFRGASPLRGFDEDIRKHINDAIAVKGIHVYAGENPASIENADDGRLLFKSDKGTEITVDNVMFATGRRPNSSEMGLEDAGVNVDPHSGRILVDDSSKTNVDNIYAVGDVTGRMDLTPVALMEGMAVANTLFGGMAAKPDYEFVPSAVFSQPEIGVCGLTEEAAAERYGSVDVYIAKFRPMKHALPTGRAEEEAILMKLVVVSDGFEGAGRVVGAHMVGEHAGEMMQGIGVAMKAGATKADFDATVGIHPTSAEEWCTMRTKARTTVRIDDAAL